MSDTPRESEIIYPRYWCKACPLTFASAETANAHHDATGHNQTHRRGAAYCAHNSARRALPLGASNE